MKRLVLFDIDGTLTRTQNGYLPFNDAIFKTFGVEGDIRMVVPDGNTDPLIVRDIFTSANLSIDIQDHHWRQFTGHLGECYRHHLGQGTTTVRPLPGAAELLHSLSANLVIYSSVVTGNFEVTAQIKLEAAGLASYLARGAYASDSAHRPDLPAIAKARCEESRGCAIESRQCVIVGDTPKDLEAARHNGMKCVLVGTGRYPVEELLYWQPDGCVADLGDTQAVLSTLLNL